MIRILSLLSFCLLFLTDTFMNASMRSFPSHAASTGMRLMPSEQANIRLTPSKQADMRLIPSKQASMQSELSRTQSKRGGELSEPPRFPNYSELKYYFYHYMVYPAEMLADNRSGYAVCRFTVDTLGRAKDPVALESSEPACAKEAIRLIRALPRGLPARDTADRRVESLYTVRVDFCPQQYYKRLQDEEEWKKGQIFAPTESLPIFPGGDQACKQFINDRLRYPPSYRGSGRKVRVICRFIINTYGEVTDVSLLRGSGLAPFDDEALRVVRLLPRWKPGYVYAPRPHYVDCTYTIPVLFVDPGEEEP